MFFKPYIPNLENEVDQAEALEVYTRWVQGEKLPGKNHKYLQLLEESSDRDKLRDIVIPLDSKVPGLTQPVFNNSI